MFVKALLTFLHFPPPYVVFLLTLVRAEWVIEVRGEVEMGVRLTPGSGVRQGDPLSPALFSVLTLVLIYDLERLPCRVRVLLYADDVLLLFEGSGQSARSGVEAVLFVMSVVGQFFGPHFEPTKVVCPF